MSKFYVGQKVRDYITRPERVGTVETIDNHATVPLNIRWNNGTSACYTLDGRLWPHYAPTLVDADDEWTVVHKPAVKFEKWERVLVRDFVGSKWQPGLYECSTGNDELPYQTAGPGGLFWRYCRKWDENLVGKITDD